MKTERRETNALRSLEFKAVKGLAEVCNIRSLNWCTKALSFAATEIIHSH